jgi:NAD(P)-dependent dehydrogenase (short-subunit alcohol dehydrogenase family)
MLKKQVLFLLLSIFLGLYINSNSNMATLRAIKESNAKISLVGKTAIVVGGTSGIGHGMALRLAKAGASVTILGRTERGIVKEMNTLSPEGSKSKHSFIPVNAFLLSGVAKAVDTIKSTHEKIDYLIQSQGMATVQGFTPSEEEGLDQKLSLHVYSRAKFAVDLQPLMEKSDNPKALSILSAGVHSSYTNYKNDPELSLGTYGIKNAADSAGFYNDIIWDSLSKQYPKTTFMHASPGFVATRWGTEMPTPIRWCVRALQIFGKSKETCAEYMFRGLTQIQGSFSSSGGGGGGETKSEDKNNFILFDERGVQIKKVTNLHNEAKEFVFNHILKVLESGKAVQKIPGKN